MRDRLWRVRGTRCVPQVLCIYYVALPPTIYGGTSLIHEGGKKPKKALSPCLRGGRRPQATGGVLWRGRTVCAPLFAFFYKYRQDGFVILVAASLYGGLCDFSGQLFGLGASVIDEQGAEPFVIFLLRYPV